MSFIDLRGEKVDVTAKQLAVLTEAQGIYAKQRKGRERHVIIYLLRDGYHLPFSQIARVLRMSRSQACRVHRQVFSEIQKISREILSRVAFSGATDD